jgi:hypothetical protein
MENLSGAIVVNSAYGSASGLKMYGNIAINVDAGIIKGCRNENSGVAQMASDAIVRDFVAVNNAQAGIQLQAVKNWTLSQITISQSAGNDAGFLLADCNPDAMGDGSPTMSAQNVSVYGAGTRGFYEVTGAFTSWLIDHPNSYGSGTPYTPPSATEYANKTTTNPAMGACYLWVPAASPMKGTGVGGADIGATILYQLQNGSPTSTKLWNTSTGAPLFAGAIVAGLNDVAGTSLLNIASRLNINQNGCAFPSAYTGTQLVVTITGPTSNPTYSTGSATITLSGTSSLP